MKKSGSSPGWQRLLSRASSDPLFVGSALAVYKMTRELDDVRLAAWLECSIDSLDRLALCRLPQREERLCRDIEQIAAFGGCDADKLVALVREVAALVAFRKTGDRARESFLVAARDREKQAMDGEDDEGL